MRREEEKTVYSVWINWKKRIISFEKEDGFQELQYQTYDEMLRFVIQKGNEGFGIQ